MEYPTEKAERKIHAPICPFQRRFPLVPANATLLRSCAEPAGRAPLLINACIRLTKVCSGGKADGDAAPPCSKIFCGDSQNRAANPSGHGPPQGVTPRSKHLRMKDTRSWAGEWGGGGTGKPGALEHNGSWVDSKCSCGSKLNAVRKPYLTKQQFQRSPPFDLPPKM